MATPKNLKVFLHLMVLPDAKKKYVKVWEGYAEVTRRKRSR